MSRLRFAVVTTHPTQHHAPLFRYVSDDPGVHAKAFYLTDHGVRASLDPGFNSRFAWDIDLTGGYEHEFLEPGMSLEHFGFWEADTAKIGARLADFQPHVIWIHGYAQRFLWRAMKWARNRACVLYFGDSELIHARSAMKRLVKSAVLPWFFGRCDVILTIGDNNEDYYRHYKVPDEKMFRGAYPIDARRFEEIASGMTQEARAANRAGLGIPEGSFVLATSGKLEPRKRPLDLVTALSHLPDGTTVHVLMIGEGVLRRQVEEASKELGLEGRVHVSGFVNQTEMPRMLACADALVMASEMDPHPLAVSEALPLGLPIIASDKVGCIGPSDTARPDFNAIVYSCGDPMALSRAIVRLASDKALVRRFSKASRSIARTQDYRTVGDVVLKSFAYLHDRHAGRFADVDRSHIERWRCH